MKINPKQIIKDSLNLVLATVSFQRLAQEAQSPLIVGGTGGSGTRVFAQIAQHSGVFMGSHLNHALDSRAFSSFLARWCSVSLQSNALPGYLRIARDLDFRMTLIKHCAALPSPTQAWGTKNPQTILILPYLNHKLPHIKFLHVIRDGRDMAFSTNQNQLQKYGAILLEKEALATTPQPVCSIEFWSLVNLRASSYGEHQMHDRYLCVRFEDLCTDPEATVKRIFDFLDCPGADYQAAAAEVQLPESLGRWREHDPALAARVTQAGREALEKFGYLSARPDR